MAELERIGESGEFAAAVVQLLEHAGWTLHEPRPALGGGLLWIATRELAGDEFEVKRVGERLADVVAELLEDAVTCLPPARRLVDVQLRLPFAA